MAVLGIDQITKWLALRALDDGPVELVWTLRLRLTFNTGTAFSLGRDRGGLIALVVVVIVLAMIFGSRSVTDRSGALAMGLVLGGALGNLADRVFREGPSGEDVGLLGGAVVDFVDLQWWPVFNAADAAIVVGGVVLFRVMSRDGRPPPAPA